jgi:hypothetical protein
MVYECFDGMIQELKAAYYGNLVYTEQPPEGRPDFLGKLTCPSKYPLKVGLESVVKQYYIGTGHKLNCYLPTGANAYNLHQDIWQVKRIDDFPEVVGAEAFDNL